MCFLFVQVKLLTVMNLRVVNSKIVKYQVTKGDG